jgi:hypothetical protein
MTDFQFEHGAYSPREAKRIRAGKKAIVGLAGLAAMSAGGLFFFTTAMPAKDQIVTDAGALAPNRSSGSPVASRTPDSPYVPSSRRPARGTRPAVSTPVRDGVAPQRSPVPMTDPSLTLVQRLAVAQSAAGGVTVPSPVPKQGTIAEAPPTDITVTESGSMRQDGTTLRLVTALGDLSGQRELAWVSDAGQPVGNSRCSQNFHRSGGAPAAEIPALLVCWRVSPQRSVIAVAVSNRGRPSSANAVAAIDRRWPAVTPAPSLSF